MRWPLYSALTALSLAGGGPAQAAITRTLKTIIPLHVSIWTAPADQVPPFGLAVHAKPGEPPVKLDKKGDVVVLDPAGTYTLDFDPPARGERKFQLLMIELYQVTGANVQKQYKVDVTVSAEAVKAIITQESKTFIEFPAALTIGTKAEPSPLFSFEKPSPVP